MLLLFIPEIEILPVTYQMQCNVTGYCYIYCNVIGYFLHAV